jgi:putative SOS response-associated peptidase YedK
MCGRYAATLPPEMMAELFALLNQIDYPPRYNIAPTQPVVCIWEQQGKRTAQLVRWGLVPGWVKDPRDFPLLINARAETMATKPAFRDSLRNQRCIIPASGYYEWMKGPDGRRQPYYITMVDGSPMAFAGLYTSWSGPEGEEVDTAAIVTVDASPDVAPIYDRMPAILRGEAIDAWLNTRDVDIREAVQLALPLPEGSIRYHPVAKTVGSSQAEGPQLIEPIDAGLAEVAPRRAAAGSGTTQLDLF